MTPNGVLLWAKRAGGIDPQYGDTDERQAIATDGAGKSLVTGYFQGTATFGEGDPNETSLTTAGYVDVFVAKYNPSGALQWARCDGGTDHDVGDGIATDGSGNSLVTGYFYETSTFGAGETYEDTLASAGEADVFVAKYDPDGALLWARSAGGTSWDCGHGIATDGLGNNLVTGVFDQPATFGTVETIQILLTTRGSDDIFIAKYDPDGALLWARGAGGTGDDGGYGIATDGSGNSLVTGKFRGTAAFGAGETGETSLVSDGDDDVFVAKYRPDGALLQARGSGGTSDDEGRAIATDDNGNGLAAGCLRGTATFGAGEPGETDLTSAGDADVFCSFTHARGATLVIEKQARSGAATNTVGFEIPDLPPGGYLVTEVPSTPGISLSGIRCSDGDSPTPSTWDLVTGRATYGLDPGERVVCVFTNVLPFVVGGAAMPADRLSLLAPWGGLAAAVSLVASTAIIVRRRRRQ